MEHLPLPKQAPLPQFPLIVPRVSTEKQNGQFFNTFPDQDDHSQKKKKKAEWQQRLQTQHLSDLMPSLQTWLFFDLLSTVFIQHPDKIWSDFSREGVDGNGATITTGHLIDDTLEHLGNSHLVSNKFTPPHRAKGYSYLRKAYEVLNIFSSREIDSDVYSKVILSLAVLGEYFSMVMRWSFPDDHSDQIPLKLLRAWPTGKLYRGHKISHLMQGDGWCRKDIARIAQNLSTSSMYYVAHFGNSDPCKSHRDCTFTSCKVAQVQDSEYRTKHVCEGGNCGHISPRQDDLIGILERGSIPLIPIMKNDTIALEGSFIELIECSASTKYVAFSHIWSEGLGNESQNSLPRCQFYTLSQYVRELYSSTTTDPVFFWIDTICCPRKPENVRRLAIRKTRDTYSGADKVLVLDSWLQAQEMQTQDVYDLALRVYVSKWNKRLWTFQEGALAKKLAFRFKDASCLYEDRQYKNDLSSLEQSLHLERKSLSQIMWRASTTITYRNLRGYQLSSTDLPNDRMRVLGIFWGFKYRDTSRKEDEALCLGAMFDLELDQILESKTAEGRMAVLWKLLPALPPSLIFSFAPRLQENGFRWAPATLRWATNAFFDDSTAYQPPGATFSTDLGTRGLVVEYPGILFTCPGAHLSNTFFSNTEQWYRIASNIYHISRSLEFGSFDVEPIAEGLKTCIDWRKNETSSSQVIGIGLILSVELSKFNPLHDCRAILVSIHRREKGITFAHFVSTVSVMPVTGTFLRPSALSSNGSLVDIVEVSQIAPKNHKWCLS